jgi:hypothetical protein
MRERVEGDELLISKSGDGKRLSIKEFGVRRE